jgi:hypothetical protein
MHEFCLSHVKISNPHEPGTGFCHNEVQENEGPDIILKDCGALTADHTNHPMMIIKESIPLIAVGAPGSLLPFKVAASTLVIGHHVPFVLMRWQK